MYGNRRQHRSIFLAAVNYNHLLFAILTYFMLFQAEQLEAQISAGGTPKSFSEALPANIDSKTMHPVNVDSLRSADELEEARGLPPRFGFALDVDLGLNNAGTWHTLPDGGRIWRLRIVAPAAFSINLIYDKFWLPPGATYFIYTQDKSMVLGAFTEDNNKDHGKFSTSLVKGPVSILEYYEPAATKQPGMIQVSKVIHGYRNFFKAANSLSKRQGSGVPGSQILDFGDAGSCNNNVHCPEGAPWSKEIRSVAMVLLADNTRWCSGALLNNVRQDFTPYFLSAFHCADSNGNWVLSSTEKSNAQTWIFMFKYESATCSNPSSEPSTSYTISSSTFRAGHADTDFLLLELSRKPPMSYNVYFSGWSNIDTAPSSSVGIHHPRGDIKKISFDDDPGTSDEYGPRPGDFPSDSHWRVVWDDGTTQRGSSGCAIV